MREAGIYRPMRASLFLPLPLWRATRWQTVLPAMWKSSLARAATPKPARRWLWQPVNTGCKQVTRPLLSSFSEEALHAARAAAPELPRALLVEIVPNDWRERLKEHQSIALNINQEDASKDLIDDVYAAGYRIAAWKVNDPERARTLLD